MPVTINDIARVCGVSRTTVIRALNNTGRIKMETKQHILKTAEQMHYRPNLVARMMVKGRSMTLGVVVVDLLNQYFPKMVNAMAEHAQGMGYQLTIGLHGGNAQTEREQINTMVGYHVDGLILSTAKQNAELEEYLASLPLPIVLLGHNLSDRFTCVGIDEVAAAREASQCLFDSGYRHIVFIAPSLRLAPEGNYGHMQRLDGVRAAIAENPGLSLTVFSDTDYPEEALKLLRDTRERVAFLCSGDVFAGKLMMRLQEHGLSAPADYGLMGFDCIDLFQSQNPPLASVDNNIELIGRGCVEAVTRMIETDTCLPSVTIPYQVRRGGTF